VPPLQHHTTHPAFALRHWILFRLPFLVRSQNPSLTTTNPTQEGAAAAASFSSGHRIRVQQQLIRHWRESRSFGTTDRFRCKKFVLLNKSPCSSPNPPKPLAVDRRRPRPPPGYLFLPGPSPERPRARNQSDRRWASRDRRHPKSGSVSR
jgi:hypothetical protein